MKVTPCKYMRSFSCFMKKGDGVQFVGIFCNSVIQTCRWNLIYSWIPNGSQYWLCVLIQHVFFDSRTFFIIYPPSCSVYLLSGSIETVLLQLLFEMREYSLRKHGGIQVRSIFSRICGYLSSGDILKWLFGLSAVVFPSVPSPCLKPFMPHQTEMTPQLTGLNPPLIQLRRK